MTIGQPKLGTPLPNKPEHWVPTGTKPGMLRDANSHPDPAFQRRKYIPPAPTINIVYGYSA